MPPLEPNPRQREQQDKLTGRAYWRSLDELTDSPRFREFLENEFADYQPEQILQSPSRRSFMKLMGASMALAGASAFSGCRRWPEQEVAPYAERPEGRTPGEPEQYATIMELGGAGRPLLVTSFDGRPTKIEGNPSHPLSNGATDTFAQASVLEMYDPERSRHVLHRAEPGAEPQRSSWQAFTRTLNGLNLADRKGEGLAVLSEATSSPSVADMRARLTEAMPQAQWFDYEPINRDNETAGARLAFGQALRPHLHLDAADVLVTFEADPLSAKHPAMLRHARQWAQRRREADDGHMNRHWAVDSGFTVTSSNADRRLPTRSGRVIEVVRALAAELGVEGLGEASLDEKGRQFVHELAEDLKAHEGSGLLVAGPSQPAEVHAAIWLINDRLGNLGTTVTFTEDPAGSTPAHTQQLRTLVQQMQAGEIHTLLILGGNPVHNSPADIPFAEALNEVRNSVHLSHYEDETSRACAWHLPRSHYLECWGDARTWDGTLSVQQPLILPLYNSKSPIELLALVTGDELKKGQQIVRRTFRQHLPSGRFEKAWRKVLHDGLLPDSGYEKAEPQLQESVAERVAAASAPAAEDGVEVVFAADDSVYDGRFANNGWLQELPRPLTKLTWDNAALVGRSTAEELGVDQNDQINLRLGKRVAPAAVFIMPGQAHGSITLALGYGRTDAGYVGNGVGFDAYPLRTSDAMHALSGVEVRKTGARYELATTQEHHAIDKVGLEERQRRAFGNMIRSATLDEYEHHPEFAKHGGMHTPKGPSGHKPLQIFEEPQSYEDGHSWGMAIDLNSCIGCNACVIACQAENNIPVVGKQEVARGREMHWIRVDRYFKGDPDDPETAHQPVTCHHCENAPCEQVCPVAATVHDSEGLNVMIYNRCIGTRYCSNNCPYKVRRFNWFDWHYKPVHSDPSGGTYQGMPDQQQLEPGGEPGEPGIHQVRRMQFNPEVSVRMRGVMEKCTFCTQRIQAKTIEAKNEWSRGERETWRVDDGAVTPACAQTCPTQAIVFGDLNDPESRVVAHYKNTRAYEMLEELNVRAHNRYLARITNPGNGHAEGGEAEPSHSGSTHG